jgi:hypothetical protein
MAQIFTHRRFKKKSKTSTYGWFFSGIASHRNGDLGKKKSSCQIWFLKMVLGSEIGLLDRKRSFQRAMGEHA